MWDWSRICRSLSFCWLIALVAVLHLAGDARAQTTVVQRPDCFLPFGPLTAAVGGAGTSAGPFDNRTLGCNTWVIDYNSFGFTVESLLVQVAPNSTNNVPGAWATFTAVTGINPNTSTTQAVTTFGGTTSYFPWLRVQLTSVTGTGSVSGVLYGWKIPAAPPGGSGCVGTAATPCVVDGPTASGVVPAFPPVLVAGRSGNDAGPGLTETIHTDTAGNVRVIGTAADGVAVTGDPVRVGGKDPGGLTQDIITDSAGRIDPAGLGTAQADGSTNTPTLPSVSATGATNRVYPFQFNAATWDRQFVCASQARVTLSDATRTELVALTASQVIRVCHIHMTTTAAEDFTISYGTGSACGTGTTTIDKYLSAQAFAMDFQPTAALRTIASNALCVTQSGTQSAEVTVIYAKF